MLYVGFHGFSVFMVFIWFQNLSLSRLFCLVSGSHSLSSLKYITAVYKPLANSRSKALEKATINNIPEGASPSSPAIASHPSRTSPSCSTRKPEQDSKFGSSDDEHHENKGCVQYSEKEAVSTSVTGLLKP
jgi:hypothetical protein